MKHSSRLTVVAGVLWGAALALAAPEKLEIAQVVIHQYEGGPPLAASYEFFPGDTVFLTFRVVGFRLVPKGNEETILLSYRISAFDPGGLRLMEDVSGKLASEVTPEDKKSKWMPAVQYNVLVPPSAPSGQHRLALSVKDENSGAAAEKEVTVQVRARHVEPSDALVVRNFRFYRGETDTRALEAAAYRPGDTLWARFDITGYKFGDGNLFSVDYGLTVLRENGKVLFSQEVAASEERKSFYPERYIAGSLSLNLTPDLGKGPYTIVLTVRDKLGNQTAEARQNFQVE